MSNSVPGQESRKAKEVCGTGSKIKRLKHRRGALEKGKASVLVERMSETVN